MYAESKKLKMLLIDIEFQEDRFQELKSAVEKLKDRKAKLKKDINAYESQYKASEEIAKRHEDMIHRFEQRLFDAKDQAVDEENKLNAILSKAESEKKKVNDELQAVKNLVSNTEDEYIKWEWLKKVKHLWSKFKQQ